MKSQSPFAPLQALQEEQREGYAPESKPTLETIKAEIREAPMSHRLEQSQRRIGAMCKEGRGPSMSVPVRAADDDMFITVTLEDAERELAEKDAKIAEQAAQIVALRDSLEMVLPMVLAYHQLSVEISVYDPALQRAYNHAVAVLSTPAPPRVTMEEAKTLADALQSLRDEQNGPPLERHKEHWQAAYDNANKVLAEFTAKHSQP